MQFSSEEEFSDVEEVPEDVTASFQGDGQQQLNEVLNKLKEQSESNDNSKDKVKQEIQGGSKEDNSKDKVKQEITAFVSSSKDLSKLSMKDVKNHLKDKGIYDSTVKVFIKQFTITTIQNQAAKAAKTAKTKEATPSSSDDSSSASSDSDSDSDSPSSSSSRSFGKSLKNQKKRKTKPTKSKLKIKKKQKTKPTRSPTLSALYLLCSAMSAGPTMFKGLKDLESDSDRCDELASRLRSKGATFKGNKPSQHDISKAKEKTLKKKMLEGLDTSLILDSSSGRGGRGGRVSRKPPVSYAESGSSEEDDDGSECEFGSSEIE